MSLSPDTSTAPSVGAWRVSVGGKAYGPYSFQQMEGFVAEGRIAAHSIVTSHDAGPWVAASDDPVLVELFMRASQPRSQTKVQPRASETVLVTEAKATGSNFMLYVDIKSRSGFGFERELAKLGDMYRISHSLYILHSDFAVGQVRNALTTQLGKTDSLLVVDSTSGKSSWFNLGPEAEAKIRKIWQRSATSH